MSRSLGEASFLLRQYTQSGSTPGTGTTRPKDITLGTALILLAIFATFYVNDLISKRFEAERLALTKKQIEAEKQSRKKELEECLSDIIEENKRLRSQLALPPLRREGFYIDEDGHTIREEIPSDEKPSSDFIRGYTYGFMANHLREITARSMDDMVNTVEKRKTVNAAVMQKIQRMKEQLAREHKEFM